MGVVCRFDTEDEAVSIANNTQFGLVGNINNTYKCSYVAYKVAQNLTKYHVL